MKNINKIWQKSGEIEIKQKYVANLLIFHSRKSVDIIKLEKKLGKNKKTTLKLIIVHLFVSSEELC